MPFGDTKQTKKYTIKVIESVNGYLTHSIEIDVLAIDEKHAKNCAKAYSQELEDFNGDVDYKIIKIDTTI